MAKTSTVSVGVTITGDGTTTSYSPTAVQNTSAPDGGPRLLVLTTGNNTITPPTGATGFTLSPGTVAKTLKGIAGDTGVPLSITGLTTVFLASAASFVINSTGGETISIFWF